MVDRRDFIRDAGVACGALFLTGCREQLQVKQTPGGVESPGEPQPMVQSVKGGAETPEKWLNVRRQFEFLADKRAETVCFWLASHPKPVHDRIQQIRAGIDQDPYKYLVDNFRGTSQEFEQAAQAYLGCGPKEIVQTISTTMGIGLMYAGILCKPGQSILSVHNNHGLTKGALNLRHRRDQTPVHTIDIYQNSHRTSVDEIVGNIVAGLKKYPSTRVLALTWVDSSTGLKLPLPALKPEIEAINQSRDESDRVLVCVDGVHGFGNQDFVLSDLGADFFVAGCHKWLFGPRGSGIFWGKPENWPYILPTIPSWNSDRDLAAEDYVNYNRFGGFQTYEHKWAVAEAFKFHLGIGKKAIADRIASLNTRLKEGMQTLPNVRQVTPMARELSAGLSMFHPLKKSAKGLQKSLMKQQIYGAVTGRGEHSVLRFSPGLVTTEAEVDHVIEALQRELA